MSGGVQWYFTISQRRDSHNGSRRTITSGNFVRKTLNEEPLKEKKPGIGDRVQPWRESFLQSLILDIV